MDVCDCLWRFPKFNCYSTNGICVGCQLMDENDFFKFFAKEIKSNRIVSGDVRVGNILLSIQH